MTKGDRHARLLGARPAASTRTPAQNANAANGAYYNLMATLNDGAAGVLQRPQNQGLLDDTLVLQFSEFGRRITENGSNGTDHGAASVMMAMGGSVNGGLYGTAPNLQPDPDNPTLENNAGDVQYETDFRSVYAQVIDDWLGATRRRSGRGLSGGRAGVSVMAGWLAATLNRRSGVQKVKEARRQLRPDLLISC